MAKSGKLSMVYTSSVSRHSNLIKFGKLISDDDRHRLPFSLQEIPCAP